MSSGSRMTALERRASVALSAVYGLRLLGMFVILPVFAIHAESLPGGTDLTLVGIAIGAYGLTQAVLQIPFGWWSDRYGRKPVICAGLAVFAAGSLVAALAADIYTVIAGRVLQGAGAVSAAVIALTADLTREEQRTKAMAMIGSTIGATFALSLVLAPALERALGVPGIFALTGVLALAAIGVVWRLIPDPPACTARAARGGLRDLAAVLVDPQLARLYWGVFVLHAVLMALFAAVPFALREAGLALAEHWKVYLPVMLGSFALMLPAVLGAGAAARARAWFVASIALVLAAQLLLPVLPAGVWPLALCLLLFFTPFNVLEAMLPSLVSRLAPPAAKGAAIGVYSSVQFFGTFLGAAGGGYLYGRWGLAGVVIANAVLLVFWLILALGTRLPARPSSRAYALPALDHGHADGLSARLRALPGVRAVRIDAGARVAHLTVDSAQFDEQNVIRLIAGET